MSVGGHASRYGDNDFLMANILTYGGYRISDGENQTFYGEYPIAYGGNHIAYGGNQIVMAKITSRHGEYYSGRAKALWSAITPGGSRHFLATVAFFAEAFASLSLSSWVMRRRSSSA